MRKPTASAWKSVKKRLDRVVAFKEAMRIGGMLARSPKLADGTIELHIGTSGRTPMSEADLSEYIAFIERRNDAQRPATYPK